MTDRNSADKGTDDARGTGGVPAETGQPSKGAARRGGASGADRDAEPGAAQRPANTPGEPRGDVAEVRKSESDTRSAAAGAGGATESVSSAQVSENASAEPGGAAGSAEKSDTAASAPISKDAAVQAGGAAGVAGEQETVTSRLSEGRSAQAGGAGAGGRTESVSSAQVSESTSAQAGGIAGAGGKTESVSSAQISEDGLATAGAAGATGKPDTVASAQAPEGAGATGNADPEAVRHSAAEGSPKETPIYESVRRAAERAEQVQADAATAAERGAAGIPGPVSRPGRTLLEMLRDKPILAAIPASTLAFILWRAFHRR
ncbi:hypothetical protein [Nocardia sp. NPDC047648]|uniref:hypothetical protein n=1 Tax=Nocardia sp. NPDC047648 TaxID=3155625 RepID=UPI0033F4B0AB